MSTKFNTKARRRVYVDCQEAAGSFSDSWGLPGFCGTGGERLERRAIQPWGHVEKAFPAIVEAQAKAVACEALDGNDVMEGGGHGSLQRADAERRVAGLGEFPIGEQFVAVDVHPDAEHAEFGVGEGSREKFAGFDGDGNLVVLVAVMKVWRVVMAVVSSRSFLEASRFWRSWSKKKWRGRDAR